MSAPWAKEEVEEADLGDERLHARLERVLGGAGQSAESEHSGRLWRTDRDGRRLSLL
jgi:hypothetical protein